MLSMRYTGFMAIYAELVRLFLPVAQKIWCAIGWLLLSDSRLHAIHIRNLIRGLAKYRVCQGARGMCRSSLSVDIFSSKQSQVVDDHQDDAVPHVGFCPGMKSGKPCPNHRCVPSGHHETTTVVPWSRDGLGDGLRHASSPVNVAPLAS